MGIKRVLGFLAGLSAAAAYDTLHVIDVASVICPTEEEKNPPASTNLAAGKTVTCDPRLECSDASVVTDGNKGCSQGLLAPSSALFFDDPYVKVDLGSVQKINEVVLFQYTCTRRSFPGHKVNISTDGINWENVYDAGLSIEQDATEYGQSMRFPEKDARYVMVFSDKPLTGDLVFLEVEVYDRSPIFPLYDIGVDYSSEMDLGAPHIFSFLRAETGAATVTFSVEDATGKTVLAETTVELMNLNTGPTIPADCSCTGQTPETDIYGTDYGRTCDDWDNEKCDEWWPGMPLGQWCCRNWCYASEGCPDRYASELIYGAYFSYDPCTVQNSDLPTCPWEGHSNDPCACINAEDIMNDAMKAKFPSDYGSSCKAWDTTWCPDMYAPEQLDNWCCKQWCYVDSKCPHAIASLNEGMEDLLFWTDFKCDQDAQKILQCPYQKAAADTEDNWEKCECLEVDMPSNLLPSGAPADYGKLCAAHDKDSCHVWYPTAETDMWCCLSWCYVAEECPDAKGSTLWEGAYWSTLGCDMDVAAITGCTYSSACQCANANDGIDTAVFGSDYGKSCSQWDYTDCYGKWSSVTGGLWNTDGRNDWCCAMWCYVSEDCPLGLKVSDGASWTRSVDVCAEEEGAGELYNAVYNTCGEPADCSCTGEQIPTNKKPTGASADYGQACAAHDANIACAADNILCCQSWCWVSPLCPGAQESSIWEDHYWSNSSCALDETAKEAFRTCSHGDDDCACIGADATGTAAEMYGQNYGKSCSAWDAANCWDWFGPDSSGDLWNTGDDTNNNWCCQPWCYVKASCPMNLTQGLDNKMYSYDACAGNSETYNEENKACETAVARRLSTLEDHASATESATSAEAMSETLVTDGGGDEENGRDGDVATVGAAPFEEGCEDFFLFDGQSPVTLPDTWDQARKAVQTVCEAEFEAQPCAGAVEVMFDNLPDEEGALCSRLFLTASLVTSSAGAVEMLPPDAGPVHDAVVAARRASDLLLERAGRSPDEGETGGGMDLVLSKKLDDLEGQNRIDSALARRLKGGSNGGGGGGWGGNSKPPEVRRRTPNRPPSFTTAQRRRSAASNTPSYRRRRSSAGSSDTTRRRTTDVSGARHTTSQGTAVPYGYTNRATMAQNYGGVLPQSSRYGYAGSNAVAAGTRKNYGMYAAAAAGGVVAGAGAYYVYNNMKNGIGDPTWRRRRVKPPEWCVIPSGDEVGEFQECGDCLEQNGFCPSAADCYEERGCGHTVREALARDDLMNTGFMPNLFQGPLTIKIKSLSGDGMTKEDVCPPTDPAEAALNNRFGKLTTFKANLFVTLTAMDELGSPETNVGSGGGSSDGRTSSGCVTNTNFACNAGARQGDVGKPSCHDNDEVCMLDQYNNYELMCYCKSGYCLEGAGSPGFNAQTAACIASTATAAMIGSKMSAAAVLLISTLFVFLS